MAPDPLSSLNVFATFRFALAHPGEQHLAFFRQISARTPETIEALRVLHVGLFEAGLPHPFCPLLESHYVGNRPAPEVVLENKLYYQHFGLNVQSKAAPDHLLTQLEFLSWLEYCIESGNPDRESLQIARDEFLARHVRHWLPAAAELVQDASGGCYEDLFEAMLPAFGVAARCFESASQ